MSKEQVQRIAPQRLLRIVGVVVGIEILLLTLWQAISPMHLNDVAVGSILHKSCSSDNDAPFLAMLACYHVLLLVYALRIAIKTSRLHTAFSEGKYIRVAIFNGLQFSSISILVLYFTNEAGTANLIRAGAVALHDISLLVFIFGPKLQMIIYGTERENSSVGIGSDVINDMEKNSSKGKKSNDLKGSQMTSSTASSDSFNQSSAASPESYNSNL